MAKKIIDIGTAPNDGEGDALRDAFDKVNWNSHEIYRAGPVDSNIRIENNDIISITGTDGNINITPDGVGTINLNNNTNIVADCAISGDTTLLGGLTVSNDVTLGLTNISNLIVQNSAVLNGSLVTHAGVTFISDGASVFNITNSGGVAFSVQPESGNTTISGSLAVIGTVSASDPILDQELVTLKYFNEHSDSGGPGGMTSWTAKDDSAGTGYVVTDGLPLTFSDPNNNLDILHSRDTSQIPTGNLLISLKDSISISNDLAVGGNISVDGQTILNDSVTIIGAVGEEFKIINGTAITVLSVDTDTGDTDIGGTVTVTGTVSANHPVAANDLVTLEYLEGNGAYHEYAEVVTLGDFVTVPNVPNSIVLKDLTHSAQIILPGTFVNNSITQVTLPPLGEARNGLTMIVDIVDEDFGGTGWGTIIEFLPATIDGGLYINWDKSAEVFGTGSQIVCSALLSANGGTGAWVCRSVVQTSFIA